MHWRLVAGFTVWAAVVALSVVDLPERGPTDATYTRQSLDANVAPRVTDAPAATSPIESIETSLPTAQAVTLPADLAAQPADLTTHTINQLIEAGAGTLWLPGYGDVTLRVHGVTPQGDGRLVQLRYGALPVTLTQRAGGFFMNVATDQGTFSVQGDDHQAWVLAERTIDQRTIGFEKDFRYVPER